nr:hypothetical protein [Treponema sp.]
VVNSINDLELTATPNETAKTVAFTVSGGVDNSYIWSVDGIKQEGETGSTFTLEATSLGTKTYVVEVVCGTRSATATAEIAWGDTYGTNKTLSEGDIVFIDGSAASRDVRKLNKMQAEAAVAVIFFVGKELNDNGDTTTKRTLGLGLHNTCINNIGGDPTAFAPAPHQIGVETNIGWSTKIENIVCSISDPGTTVNNPENAYGAIALITSDKNGSDNWQEICQVDPTGTANAATYYPAFNWVNNYGTATGAAKNLAGTDYESGWFLPSLAELCWLYQRCAGNNNLINKINEAKPETPAELINTTDDGSSGYWSSSEPSAAATDAATYGEYAYYIDFNTGEISKERKDYLWQVLCIREF